MYRDGKLTSVESEEKCESCQLLLGEQIETFFSIFFSAGKVKVMSIAKIILLSPQQRCQPLETLNREIVFFSLPPPPSEKWTQPPMGMT